MRTLKLLIVAAVLMAGTSVCSARPWVSYAVPTYNYYGANGMFYPPSYYYRGFINPYADLYSSPYSAYRPNTNYYSPYSAYYGYSPTYYYGW